MSAAWKTQLEKLQKNRGGKKGAQLKKYLACFPSNYLEDHLPTQAIDDINHIEKLSTTNPLDMDFYYIEQAGKPTLHLRLFQWQAPIALSDILPILENMDLRTLSESPYQLTIQKQSIYISDFSICYIKNKPINLKQLKDLFTDALLHIFLGNAESDGFNKLILSAALSWKKIIILRAYAKYLRKVGFRFSQAYIEQTLANHPALAETLVNLFLVLHDPKQKSTRHKIVEQLEKKLINALESVTSLDEDKIIRRYLSLIKATLRTNYFQTSANKQPKPYLAIKLNSRAIPELPLPVPLYEIFVYSPRFEAIHLRNTKVARGGIRWSDRREDFRTEILGLMKAQTVKNAVIIPSGAKGG